jgi:hypothetical protein
MNDLLIAQRLAAAIQLAATVEGEDPIRSAYATPPDSLGPVPALCVFAGSDAITYGAANRITELRYTCRIYLRVPGDLGRRTATLLKWRTALRNSVLSDWSLGGACDVAKVTETRVLDDEYAGEQYIAVEADVAVTRAEHVSVD